MRMAPRRMTSNAASTEATPAATCLLEHHISSDTQHMLPRSPIASVWCVALPPRVATRSALAAIDRLFTRRRLHAVFLLSCTHSLLFSLFLSLLLSLALACPPLPSQVRGALDGAVAAADPVILCELESMIGEKHRAAYAACHDIVKVLGGALQCSACCVRHLR